MKNFLILILLALVGSLYSEVVNSYTIVGYKNEMRVVEIVLEDEITGEKVIVSVDLAKVEEEKENNIKSKVSCIGSYFYPRAPGHGEKLVKDEMGYLISPLMDAKIWVRAGREKNIDEWYIHPPTLNIKNLKKYMENNPGLGWNHEKLEEEKDK